MATFNLKDLAKRGAVVRVAELQAELVALFRAFPDLRKGSRPLANTDDGTTVLPGRKRRKRKPMSAAQKRAVGIRMKAYWAKRRKAKRV
jgi:hypothetical protein